MPLLTFGNAAMIRTLLATAALGLMLTACSDPQPAPDNKPPKPQATPDKPVATPKAVEPVSPSLKTIFTDAAACQKAGFTPKQCNDAWSVSSAMASAAPASYLTSGDCRKYFKACLVRPSAKDGKRAFAPAMAGFSVGNEKPGVDRKPTPENPQWYAPVYQDNQGRWVYLLQDKNGKLMAVPVMDPAQGSRKG